MISIKQRLILAAVGLGTAVGVDGGGALVTTPVFANEVEASLVRGIVGLREAGLRQAMGEIDKALARNPNFKLGHLVRGDMLMARAGKPVAFAALSPPSDAVSDLQQEAKVRLQRYLVDAPRIDALPAPVLQLAPSQPHVLVVDTTRNRLYVYANHRGQPRYVADFYTSLGKNGVVKERAGDQKTPLGVYTVIAAKQKLPDLYGPGAFPLDYPNEWDRMHRRNGHGIWVHGTMSETYSRAPQATDGCVVLSNEDFQKLSRFVDVNRTPVVIGRAIEWRDAAAWQAERDGFLAAFARWKSDWESRDVGRYLSHYSPKFRSETRDFASWSAQKRKVGGGKQWIKVGVKDMSVFAYPDAADTMVVTFEQDYRSNNLSNKVMKRQYWVREGPQWRILHEAVL